MKKLKSTIVNSLGIIPVIVIMSFFSACPNGPSTGPGGNNDALLTFNTRAEGAELGSANPFGVVIVTASGEVINPTSVTWSSSNTSVVSINSSGVATGASVGNVVLKAEVSYKGKSLSISTPYVVWNKGALTVTPSALLGITGDIFELLPIFMSATGPINPSDAVYEVADSSIVTVTTGGIATLGSGGETTITVKATISGQEVSQIVPVLVVSPPTVPLPITSIKVTPVSSTVILNDTKAFSAVAKNSNGDIVNTTFNWSTSDTSIATVDSSGFVTTTGVGKVVVSASAGGITGQASMEAWPEKAIFVDPPFKAISKGGTQQFDAAVWNLRTDMAEGGHTFVWSMYNWPSPFDFLNVATVDANGLVTVKPDALDYAFGSLLVMDSVDSSIYGGAGILVGTGSVPDCGSGDLNIATLTIADADPINASLFGPPITLSIDALDGFGSPVSSPDIRFWSEDTSIAQFIDPMQADVAFTSMGTTVLHVCSGSTLSDSITINVN